MMPLVKFIECDLCHVFFGRFERPKSAYLRYGRSLTEGRSRAPDFNNPWALRGRAGFPWCKFDVPVTARLRAVFLLATARSKLSID
jgi:hypothetical protein